MLAAEDRVTVPKLPPTVKNPAVTGTNLPAVLFSDEVLEFKGSRREGDKPHIANLGYHI